MQLSGAVSADPCPPRAPDDDVCTSSCFACDIRPLRQTLQDVILTPAQIQKRTQVETGSVPNPFRKLDIERPAKVALCTARRSKSIGWQAICNPKKFGRWKVQALLKAWRSRATIKERIFVTRVCAVCQQNNKELPEFRAKQLLHESEARNPRRDLNLFNISVSAEDIRYEFEKELCRLSSADGELVSKILSYPSEYYFCHVHLNHVRYAREYAMDRREGLRGSAEGSCLFIGNGCRNSGSRLRPLPKIEGECLDSIEKRAQFHDAVHAHSSGAFSGEGIDGRYVCSQCLWIVTQGQHGCAPQHDVASLSEVVDRWLVRCMLYALENSVVNSSRAAVQATPGLFEGASKLRNYVKEPIKGVQVLPFRRVVQCRRSIVELQNASISNIASNIDPRTMESRISSVLSSKNIHLKKVSTRTRCYIVGGSFEAVLASKISSSTVFRNATLQGETKLEMLDKVGNRFQEEKKKYWNGDWSLNEEISKIPVSLWRDYMVQMSSQRKRLSWRIAAAANDSDVYDLFHLCNKPHSLPQPTLEDCLSDSNSEHNRADLLLCIRTLKVIEQVVFSRTNRIIELSPSFRSVENALGLSLSYNVTEAYRLRLISERERAPRGAFESVLLGNNCIPLCQFDNWDILPLHAVKAEGKTNPKVNGSLVQGVVRKRRFESAIAGNDKPSKRQQLDWRPTITLGDRFNFADSFTSTEHDIILEEFFDVVYGLVVTHRDELLAEVQSSSQTGRRSTKVNAPPRKRTKLSNKGVVNFRSLLLSAFQPHGGVTQPNDEVFDQHVVYIDISRETASSILTVQRMLNLIETLVRPRTPGSPKFVVVSGDQPSYKMLVELWLASWKESRKGSNGKKKNTCPLHERLIPFPGFFHAEKQVMYSLCKELLDGLGLHELAKCVGMSNSHIQNILKHSHARNNRAFLFTLACALVIHSIDKVLDEHPKLRDEVVTALSKLQNEKSVTTEAGGVVEESEVDGMRWKESGVLSKTMNVLPGVLEVGSKLKQAVRTNLCNGPNGRHFIGTILFGALLPTVGFHVLSRTGHTDVTEAFWFRLTYLLHASNHLKYQELALFYGFLRKILPQVVVDELHNITPGSSVVKLPSFTGCNKVLLDKRGWTYVHLDELLEMLIVRHLKSLSVTLLSHLENAAAWLMQVSRFRSLARRITGASRAYGRVRGADDTGEENGPLRFYDRNTPQSRSVSAMLRVMRSRGFLDASHRGSDWLINVFSEPPQRMAKVVDQNRILNIEEYGRITTALHASVIFPETFGRLSEQDRCDYFGGKKFRKWTTCRRVPTPRQYMLKDGGCVSLSSDEDNVVSDLRRHKRPKDSNAVVKTLTERRTLISKTKDSLYLSGREAEREGNTDGKRDAAIQWDLIHKYRHLISSKADAFFEPSGSACHAQKSRMLKVSTNGGRSLRYTLNHAFSAESGEEPSRDRFMKPVDTYFSLQIDVMNSLHNPENGAGRGTRLVDVITAKMKRLLQQWITGNKAKSLRQVHLHIDDPGIVLPQKQVEQGRRDSVRMKTTTSKLDDEGDIVVNLPDCFDELVVPWGYLIRDRAYKDQLASLHLLCRATAAEEICEENKRDITIFLHGGAFVIPKDFNGMKASELTLRRATGHDKEHFRGRIVADYSARDPENSSDDKLIAIPRGTALVFDSSTGMRLGEFNIQHGEAETRIVAVFKYYIKPCVDALRTTGSMGSRSNMQRANRHTTISSVENAFVHSCVILSDDTDVFFILLLARVIRGFNVVHVLTDSIHDIDCALRCLRNASTTSDTIASVYAFAGCDFTPGTYAITHDVYLSSYASNVQSVGNVSHESSPDVYETIMCLAYLRKYGFLKVCTSAEKNLYRNELLRKVNCGELLGKDLTREMKCTFACDHSIGSREWKIAVRNFMADDASSLCNLIPSLPHIAMQAARVRFIVHHYWSRSADVVHIPSSIGGCSAMHGYTENGEAIFEDNSDVEQLDLEIKNLFSTCGCKGQCNNNRCSCRKRSRKCIGCSCSSELCQNRIAAVRTNGSALPETQSVAPDSDATERQGETAAESTNARCLQGVDESESSCTSDKDSQISAAESISSRGTDDPSGVIDELIDDEL